MKQKIIKLINHIRTDGNRRERGLAGLVLILTLSFFSLSSTFALTYSSDADLRFTFNPSVTVAISGDLVIDNLPPGNTADSNDITITASTNYTDGLILTGTVGNSTDTNPSHNNTSLTHANGTNTFTSLLPTDSYSNLNDNAITTNTWGYATKPTSGDNQTWSSYSGLPIYNDASGGAVLLTTTTLGTNTLLFKIGAKSLSTQVAGTYTNTINFTATTRIVTTNYTISYTDTTSEATNLPANQAGTITAPTYVNLSQTVPERASYSFVGWCSVDNSSDPSTCNGTTYQPGDAITVLNPGGSLTVPLYAVWEEDIVYTVSYDIVAPGLEDTIYVTDASGLGEYHAGDEVEVSFTLASRAEMLRGTINVRNSLTGSGPSYTSVTCGVFGGFNDQFIMPNQNVDITIYVSGKFAGC